MGISAGLLAVALWHGNWFWAPLVLWLPIAAWLPWFFRNPEPHGPRGPNLVTAPANGRVVSVIEIDEPQFLRTRARRISIFMNVFDVHVNRHPVSGHVAHRQYRPGRFVNATLDKASSDNEQMELGIQSPRGPVLVKQIAGLIARRIVCDPDVGDAVTQGTRLGLIRFGSRVDIFLPMQTVPVIRLGDRTVAGETVVAEWPEEVA